MYARDPYRILINYRYNDGGTVAAASGKGLQVRLQAGTSTGVAAGDGKRYLVSFHIFHVSILYALSQKSHSSFTPVTNALVISSLTDGEALAA